MEKTKKYYAPSDSYEMWDGENYYNHSGDLLNHPENISDYEYVPMGDE